MAVFEKDSGSSSGGDGSYTPTYGKKTLTSSSITLSGDLIHEYAQLTATENRLHNNGECSYCDQIRQWQEQGRVIAIYDVSVDVIDVCTNIKDVRKLVFAFPQTNEC